MNTNFPAFSLPFLLASAGLGFAQGGDTCATPTPISGPLHLTIDNEANTDSGFAGGGACSAVAAQMTHDQFFLWTALEPGSYAFQFTGRSFGNFDTKVAIYSGTDCSATCIAASDDPTSRNSVVHFTAFQAGEQVLVQAGGWFTGTSWNSLPDLQVIQLEGDSCHFPASISATGSHEFAIRRNSASGFQGQSPCAAPAPTVADQIFHWTAAEAGDYWFDSYDSDFECYVSAYSGNDCTAACIGVAPPSSGSLGKAKLLVPGVQAGDELLVQVSADWPLMFSGAMQLNIYRDACAAPDALEPNDVHTMATPIGSGSFQALAVNNVTDDVDYFSLYLEPEEAAFASIPHIEGGEVYMRAHGADGNSFNTFLGSEPDGAFFVNTRAYGSTFYVSVLSANGAQLPCTRYDLDLAVGPDPCNRPDGDPTGENDDCSSALPLSPGIHTGHFISMVDPDYYEVTIAAGTTFRVDFFDTEDFYYASVNLRSGSDCDGSVLIWGNSEGLEWTNTSPLPYTAILEIRRASVGDYVNKCATYSMRISGGDPIGTNYCDATVPNSSGRLGKMAAIGSTTAASNQLTLHAFDLPSNSYSYFIGAQTQGMVSNPGGSEGTLCLGSGIARLSRQAGAAEGGTFSRTIDLQHMPEPPLYDATVMAGQTWNFQLWHRDFANGVVTSNFTGGISVNYQ